MGKKDRNSFKKRVAAFLAILLALTMILSMAAPFLSALVYASSETTEIKEEEPVEFGANLFTIDAKLGFENTYMLEQTTPFSFIVTNNGGDFKGDIQLKVYLYEGSEAYSKKYAVYYLPIELAPNATKEVSMDVNLTALRSYFTVSMEDAKGNTVYQQNFPALARSPESVWTAFLTDNPSELIYMKETGQSNNAVVEQSYGATLFESFFLTEKTFPTDAAVLKNFRALIINDFNTDMLSAEQTEALKEWVYAGGMLILGTGVNAHKVLNNLDIANFTYTNNTFSMTNEEGFGFTVSDVEMDGGIQAKDTVLPGGTDYKAVGGGSVVLHKYDLGKNPLPTVKDIALSLADTYQNISPNTFYAQRGYFSSNNYDYYEARSISQNIAPVKGNDIDIIYFLIFIYIIIIGPVCYIYLKKKDKRERGWVIIPVLSLIVTAVVYCMGLGSYYRGSTVNVVSAIELNYGSPIAQADMFVGIKSSEKGDLKFKGEDDILIEATPEYYYYYYNSQAKDELTMKVNATGIPEITYANREAWSSNTFTSQKTLDMGGTVDAELKLDGQYIRGSVSNNTSFDLETVVLSYGSRFFGIGDIPSGATVTVDLDNSSVSSTSGSYYSYHRELEEIFGIDYRRYGGGISKTEDITDYYIGYTRYRLLTGKLDRSYGYYNDNIGTVNLFAFNNKENLMEGNKYLNGKLMQQQQENIFMLQLPMTFASGSQIDIPFGFIKPSEIIGINGELIDYYPVDNYVYAYNIHDLEATFELPTDVDVTNFIIQWDSYYGSLLSGEIYNWETESWEETMFGGTLIGASPVRGSKGEFTNTAPYINSEGEIKIIGHFDSTDMDVPQISVKGGVK